MKEYIRYIIIGILIGIGKIIPGVSGAVIAISLGVYDKGIEAITHFKDDMRKNILFLGNIGMGVLIGIILFSKVINYLINNYYVLVIMLFCGLILGSMRSINRGVKKDKVSYVIMTLSLIFIVWLGISNVNSNYVVKNNIFDYVIYFCSGIMEAIGTVIPGVSSTALLMIMGIYNMFIGVISNLTNVYDVVYNFGFILSFGLGMLIGIIVVAIVMDYLFRNYKDKTYAFIMGVSLGSIILMVIRCFSGGIVIRDFVLGLGLFLIGIIISWLCDA